MSTPYDFKDQKCAGDRGEAVLDHFFSRVYAIEPATDDQQRRGIDRWFTNRKTGHRFTVEYKSDALAGRTGNAFVETTSDKARQKPGWAYSSAAEYLVYYVLEPEAIYILRLADLRRKLWDWERQYPHKEVKNTSWTTEGLLVPLREFERLAVMVV
jgi:hypothetical protein